MTRTATKTPAARQDLVEIAVYIGRENPDAASRFLAAAEDAFTRLARFPGMGPRRRLSDPKYEAVRFWPIKGFRKYLIFYTPTRRGIRVLRVLHGARDLGQVFGP